MRKQNFLCWCSASLFKLLLVSVLLQSSFGFIFNEDDFADDVPGYFHYFQEVPWTIPQKIPRGYMYPVPRVGRRNVPGQKRQSMIPQPRIGRELEDESQLAEILYNIRKFFPAVKVRPQIESETAGKGKTIAFNSGDATEEFRKYLPEELRNSAFRDKDSTSKVTSDEESLNSLKESNPDQKFSLSFPTKEDSIFSKGTKNSGFDIFEEDKRDAVLHLGRADKSKLLSALEDKKQIGGLIAYPRLGRHVFELHSSLFPFSRPRGFLLEPELTDYDLLLNPETDVSGIDDVLTDVFLTSQPVKKNRSLKLIPRIGRKKRSVPEDEKGPEKPQEVQSDQDTPNSPEEKRLWQNFDEIDDEYLYSMDKRNLRSKNAFIPRIGKKSFENLDVYDDKRAMMFTPRIGRAALIPRIGRGDPRFRLRSRGAFVPRIGRRAALIPRIGRSSNQQEANIEQNE